MNMLFFTCKKFKSTKAMFIDIKKIEKFSIEKQIV